MDDQPEPGRKRHPRPDGQTADDREAPFTEDPGLYELERAAARAAPSQLALFAGGPDGAFTAPLGGLPPLTRTSSLDLARAWYRRSLEGANRPGNTIDSYCYDLSKLQERTGPKRIDRIGSREIAEFLGLANTRSTRKRRLTSARRFFAYLVNDAKVLTRDPTEGFHPHSIQLKSPIPLNAQDQQLLLEGANTDEAWSSTAVHLMMRLGLTRAELLALRREHIDISDPEEPVVNVLYEELGKQGKERKLRADAGFAEAYATFLEARRPVDLLFPVGFQAINGMVTRVAIAAGISREVTPQILRHTFAVEHARGGADEPGLLKLLGLADDPRNRASVQRYIRLAEPPL